MIEGFGHPVDTPQGVLDRTGPVLSLSVKIEQRRRLMSKMSAQQIASQELMICQARTHYKRRVKIGLFMTTAQPLNKNRDSLGGLNGRSHRAEIKERGEILFICLCYSGR
jgi:hypothetical protein